MTDKSTSKAIVRSLRIVHNKATIMSVVHEQFRMDTDSLESAVQARRSTLTANEKLILGRIHGRIDAAVQPYDVNENEQSPTPLDAENLFVHDLTYNSTAVPFMMSRLDQRLEELGAELPDLQYNAIMAGIDTEHEERVRQNTVSLQKLVHAFLHDPSTVDFKLADSTYLSRIGGASLHDFVNILASNPRTGVEAIEVSKYTKPLDPEAITMRRRILIAKFMKLQNENRDFSFRLLSNEEERETRRSVDLGELGKMGNVAIKSAMARMSFNGIDMTLKHRESFILLPTSIDLGANPKNIQQVSNQEFNVQPIGYSIYGAVDLS